ncbi:hypothetical protein EGX94_06370 [Propionibacterium acidifaciens]|nr:hypothetical protein EGX94_06370 [Propionibacterium acidifaciens]
MPVSVVTASGTAAIVSPAKVAPAATSQTMCGIESGTRRRAPPRAGEGGQRRGGRREHQGRPGHRHSGVGGAPGPVGVHGPGRLVLQAVDHAVDAEQQRQRTMSEA